VTRRIKQWLQSRVAARVLPICCRSEGWQPRGSERQESVLADISIHIEPLPRLAHEAAEFMQTMRATVDYPHCLLSESATDSVRPAGIIDGAEGLAG